MKSYFKFRKISIIVLLAVICLSCSNKKDEPETNNTITDIASRKSDLKIFTQALNITGFADLYKQSGAHTIFAPSNDAFTTFLTAKGFATINDVPVDQLKNLLLNHIINGSFQTTQLTTKYVKSLAFGSASATNELSLYVDTTAGIKVNGVATVVTSNIVASNGVIHIVDTVIDLPTIATHTSANLNLSSFANTLALPAQSAVLSNITSSTVFTVFEPTNDAFTSLDTELTSSGGIAGVSDANMSKILSYHITNGNTLSTAFSDGLVFSTLTVPQSFTLQVTGGTKITDSNNRIANVTYTNVQCNNGVIHIIDKVLLPNL